MRIEIVKPDENKVIAQLWDRLYPLNKTSDNILVFMTYDGGQTGDKRAMVIDIKDLNIKDVNIH